MKSFSGAHGAALALLLTLSLGAGCGGEAGEADRQARADSVRSGGHVAPTAADEPAQPETFVDLDGREHRPLAQDGEHELTALIFITVDCPVANGSVPAVRRIIDDYRERGVRFFLVHVDRRVDTAAAREHARSFSLDEAGVLLDHDHQLVEALGVSVTPEAAVLDRSAALIYRGRINDQWADFTVRRLEPRRHDLQEALEAALAGEAVAQPRTDAVGCFIPEYPDG